MSDPTAIRELFLVERAAQIQRLRKADEPPQIAVPRGFSKLGYSASATQLYKAVDRICQIPLADEASRSAWLGIFSAKSSSEGEGMLSASDRDLIEEFETLLVRELLQGDNDAAEASGDILTAIHDDFRNFWGLKPFAFQTERMPHEFLFPSGLNLYTALSLGRNSEGNGLELEKIRLLFEFLEEYPLDGFCLGAITFAAHRLPLEAAARFLQRAVDLKEQQQEDRVAPLSDVIKRIYDETKTADQLLRVLRGFVVYESCRLRDSSSKYRIADEIEYEPLPACLTSTVDPLWKQPASFVAWANFMIVIGEVIDEGYQLDFEFVELLESRPDQLFECLKLLVASKDRKPLSREGQRLLARVMRHAEELQQRELSAGHAFATHYAARLHGLDERAIELFELRLIEDEPSRRQILKAVGSTERAELMQAWLDGCRNVDDPREFLACLGVLAVLDDSLEGVMLEKTKQSIQLLLALQKQGYISVAQLDRLVTDLADRLPESMHFLADPYRGARDQEDRIARLYITLHEERETFVRTGTVGNFGLTRAAYSNLRRSLEET